MMIPNGCQFYPLELIADVARAKAVGIAAPAENPLGVWLHPDQFREIRKMVDPAAARHIERQQAGCGGCGG